MSSSGDQLGNGETRTVRETPTCGKPDIVRQQYLAGDQVGHVHVNCSESSLGKGRVSISFMTQELGNEAVILRIDLRS